MKEGVDTVGVDLVLPSLGPPSSQMRSDLTRDYSFIGEIL